MNLFKKLGSWLKSLFGKKPKELPAPPPQEDLSLTEALETLAKLAEQFVDAQPEMAPSKDYHSGDRLDNKPKALRLAAGEYVGSLCRDIDPSSVLRTEYFEQKEKHRDPKYWEEMAVSPKKVAKKPKKKSAPRKPKKETSKSKEVRLSPKRKTKLNLTHSGYFDDTRDRPKGQRK
jgi:hypothetical protein